MNAAKSIPALVAELPVFAGLGDAFCEQLAGCARNQFYRKDNMLFRSGEAADAFYIIRHGRVSLEHFAPGRGARTFMTVGDGEVLGVSWLIPPYAWNFDARALRDTRVLAFDAICLRQKCDGDPAVGYALMKRLTPILIQRMQAARLQSLDVSGAPDGAGTAR